MYYTFIVMDDTKSSTKPRLIIKVPSLDVARFLWPAICGSDGHRKKVRRTRTTVRREADMTGLKGKLARLEVFDWVMIAFLAGCIVLGLAYAAIHHG